MIPGVNFVIYGSSPARTTPGVSLYWSLTLEENIGAVITQEMVVDDNLKRHIKNRTLWTCRLFLLNKNFSVYELLVKSILAFTQLPIFSW